MTRETTEDRETAALRSARLAYTRASRDVDACDRWLAIPLDERTAARKVGAR